MNSYVILFSGILKITLLDVVLSGDNIGIIALSTRQLPTKLAKKASFIGVVLAILLRIIFTSLVTYLLLIAWLPIRLIGGTILLFITYNLISSKTSLETSNIKESDNFKYAVLSIVLADLTMSFDNVLAIAASAHGNLFLVIFGLALNIPIIFWGSIYVAKIMKKYPITIYIGAAILIHTAFEMIFGDSLISKKIPIFIQNFVPIAAAVLTISYGFYITNTKK